MIYNPAAAIDFIVSAVAKLVQTGLSGYNLDAEFPNDTNKTDGQVKTNMVLFGGNESVLRRAKANRMLNAIHCSASSTFLTPLLASCTEPMRRTLCRWTCMVCSVLSVSSVDLLFIDDSPAQPGDGSSPYDFHVWGPMYRASKIDRVVTMATYTPAKRNFDR